MPVETIKCRECGSADVTEFKPGSYVCGHCEAIFKHVAPAGAVVGCEIDGCGVPAVGRCSSCNRRFCRTHTGDSAYGRCAECQAAEAATAAQQELDREAAADQRELERVAALQRKLKSIGDPTERLVTALRLLCEIRSTSYAGAIVEAGLDNLRVLFNVCPELWTESERASIDKAIASPPPLGFFWPPPHFGNSGTHDKPLWNGQVIAQWFATRARAVGLKPDIRARWPTLRINMFGKSTGKVNGGSPEPAWAFPEGSTFIDRADKHKAAYVFPDGRLLLGHIADDGASRSENLRGVALKRMAELVEGS